MVAHDEKPELCVTTVAEWQSWLEDAPDPSGIRLRLRKKASKQPGITYAEALDVALCFGWIDGQSKSLDSDYFHQSFTPRRKQSPWSKVNTEHVARLIADGRMQTGGLAEIDRAKADGRWDAAYSQRDAVVPAELQSALDANPVAAAAFAALSSQKRFAMIFRISQLKREATRISKAADYVELLTRGESPG